MKSNMVFFKNVMHRIGGEIMKKRILYASLSFALVGSMLVGCGKDKEEDKNEDKVGIEETVTKEDKDGELKGDVENKDGKIIEKVKIEKNSDGKYVLKMFNVYGDIPPEDENLEVDGVYLTMYLDDEELEAAKKEYLGNTEEVIKELKKGEGGSHIVEASFNSKTMTMNLDIDTSIENWENGVGIFMWMFNLVAVPENALNGIVTNFGVDYVIKDSKTGEVLDVSGNFSINETIDLSDADWENAELGEGVTVNPTELEDDNEK